jgi:hypothetical protein
MTTDERIAALEAQVTEYKMQHGEMHRIEHETHGLAMKFIAEKLADLNNWRGRYVEKEWFERVHAALSGRVGAVEEWRWKAAGVTAAVMILGSVIGWAIGVLQR